MTDVPYSGTKLKLGNTEVEFEYPIEKTVAVDDVILVLLDSIDGDSPGPRNVVALDPTGTELWRIERPDWNPGRFLSLYEADGQIKARHTNAAVYRVDPETGTIEGLHLQK